MSITPKQAFEAAKVLWPSITAIKKYSRTDCVFENMDRSPNIDWGDTDQYPLPEPEWVDAVMPDDWGMEARFSDDKRDWTSGMISGYSTLPDRSFRWWSGFSVHKFCQVRKVKT